MSAICQKENFTEMNNICEPFGETDRRLENATKDLKQLKSGPLKIEHQFKIPEMPLNMTTIEEFQNQIKVVLKDSKQYFKWVISLMKKLLIVIFLLVFFSSKSYHNKYLKYIYFDNLYITTYFRRIDARRRHAVNKFLF